MRAHNTQSELKENDLKAGNKNLRLKIKQLLKFSGSKILELEKNLNKLKRLKKIEIKNKNTQIKNLDTQGLFLQEQQKVELQKRLDKIKAQNIEADKQCSSLE